MKKIINERPQIDPSPTITTFNSLSLSLVFFFSAPRFSHFSTSFLSLCNAGEHAAPPPANVRRRSNVASKITLTLTLTVTVLRWQSLSAAAACDARCFLQLTPSASSFLARYSTYRVGSDRTRQCDRVQQQRLSLAPSRRNLRRHDWSRARARVHRERPERRWRIPRFRFNFNDSRFLLFLLHLLRNSNCGFRLLHVLARRVLVPDLWT